MSSLTQLSLRLTRLLQIHTRIRLLQTSSVQLKTDGDDYFKKMEYGQKIELREKARTELMSKEIFVDQDEKNKETFKNALEHFVKRDNRRRGAVEFILAALKNMKLYGVHKDLDTYRALFEVLPKGKYVPGNIFQAHFGHYPKQQNCALQVLTQMAENSVIPDEEFGEIIKNTFGTRSGPFRKYCRMMYWLPKFKNLSPWPLPFILPKDTQELGMMAIKQITSVDRHTDVKVYECDELEESVDKTWIVSGQSPKQREIIETLPKNKALYVEGAFRVWLRDVQVNYFILRGEPIPRPPPITDTNDSEFNKLKLWMIGEYHKRDTVKIPNVHEQEDGEKCKKITI